MNRSIKKLHSLAGAAVLSCFLVFSGSAFAWGDKRPTRLVAQGGQMAPGTSATFIGFDEPMVNGHSDTAFIGYLSSGGPAGVFLWHAGAVSLVARTGQIVPGLGVINTYEGPAINKAKTVIFGSAPPATPAVLEKRFGSPLFVLVKAGDAVPGGGTFYSFDDISLNDVGDVAFIATYLHLGTFHGGVFVRWANGTKTAIVRDGDTLPGTGGGKLSASQSFYIDGPWLNNKGDVAFQPEILTGAPALGESLFIKRKGRPIHPVLFIGTSTQWGTIHRIGIARPGINNEEAGVKLSFGPNEETSPSIIATVELEGESEPHKCMQSGDRYLTRTIVGFQDPAITADEKMVTSVKLSDGTYNIFTCHDRKPRAVALSGDPRPFPATGTFGTLDESSIGGGEEGFEVWLDESYGGVFVSQRTDH